MKKSSEQTLALQKIQDEIIAFIKAHTENGRDDPLALALRKAITSLNDAKIVIVDRAVAAGELPPRPPFDPNEPIPDEILEQIRQREASRQ
jgi:hypothetical protein